MASPQTILRGVPVKTFDAIALSSPLNGTSFALPARASQLEWQVILPVAPNAITVNLQFSLDNVNWITVDSSTQAAGDLRMFTITGAQFVRGQISALTIGAGTTITMLINCLSL